MNQQYRLKEFHWFFLNILDILCKKLNIELLRLFLLLVIHVKLLRSQLLNKIPINDQDWHMRSLGLDSSLLLKCFFSKVKVQNFGEHCYHNIKFEYQMSNIKG